MSQLSHPFLWFSVFNSGSFPSFSFQRFPKLLLLASPPSFPPSLLPSFFSSFLPNIFLFISNRKREGEGESDRNLNDECLLHSPYWGLSLQQGHVVLFSDQETKPNFLVHRLTLHQGATHQLGIFFFFLNRDPIDLLLPICVLLL